MDFSPKNPRAGGSGGDTCSHNDFEDAVNGVGKLYLPVRSGKLFNQCNKIFALELTAQVCKEITRMTASISNYFSFQLPEESILRDQDLRLTILSYHQSKKEKRRRDRYDTKIIRLLPLQNYVGV
ncbi:hypothetical protein WN51_00846 [Melipona quadrifasciata]|uniref:Uncharacterized protein n=1 Tax=Melipona quadrifasciata TaxID=166423 RepID=A0A0N0U7J7_9HYME|nr:hypothetical protein WN51_00846 [Melipona quadrifasciata]